MRTLFCLALSLALSAGCSLQRSPIFPLEDSGEMDSGIDAGIQERDVPEGFDGGVDTGVDTGMMDTGVDTGVPDTGVDAGMPDTGVDAGIRDTGVDAPVRLTCEERYDTAPSYFECTAPSETECEFYVLLGGNNCSALCSALGGACVRAYDNGSATGSNRCMRDGDESCDEGATDRICVCTRP